MFSAMPWDLKPGFRAKMLCSQRSLAFILKEAGMSGGPTHLFSTDG